MINYKTSDIVERARQIADLENSKFISWRENIALLNENYMSLYQKLINWGDKTFLKVVSTTLKEWVLPEDFYSLAGVFQNVNGIRKPILRRAASESLNGLYYEIEGTTLKIYGQIFGGDFIIEYYPKPKTLTYPNEKAVIDGIPKTTPDAYDFTPMYAFKNLVFGSDSNGGNDIYDLYNKVWIDTNITFTTPHYFAGPFIFAGSKIYSFYNTDSSNIDVTGQSVIIKGSQVYIRDNSTMEISEVTAGLELIPTDYSVDLSADHVAIFTDDFENFYSCDNQNNWNYNGEFIQADDYIQSTIFTDKGSLYLCSPNADFIKYTGKEKTVIGNVYDYVYNPGQLCYSTSSYLDRGLAFTAYQNGKYFILPFCPDVILKLPSSFYFTLIAYYMAFSYKARQGSDTTQLSAMIQQQEETFYNTLSNDNSGPVRINHVY